VSHFGFRLYRISFVLPGTTTRRACRKELTQTQLQNKNPSEKMVDKDNHLRDALKYLVLSLPEPTQKTVNQIIPPGGAEGHNVGGDPGRSDQGGDGTIK